MVVGPRYKHDPPLLERRRSRDSSGDLRDLQVDVTVGSDSPSPIGDPAHSPLSAGLGKSAHGGAVPPDSTDGWGGDLRVSHAAEVWSASDTPSVSCAGPHELSATLAAVAGECSASLAQGDAWEPRVDDVAAEHGGRAPRGGMSPPRVAWDAGGPRHFSAGSLGSDSAGRGISPLSLSSDSDSDFGPRRSSQPRRYADPEARAVGGSAAAVPPDPLDPDAVRRREAALRNIAAELDQREEQLRRREARLDRQARKRRVSSRRRDDGSSVDSSRIDDTSPLQPATASPIQASGSSPTDSPKSALAGLSAILAATPEMSPPTAQSDYDVAVSSFRRRRQSGTSTDDISAAPCVQEHDVSLPQPPQHGPKSPGGVVGAASQSPAPRLPSGSGGAATDGGAVGRVRRVRERLAELEVKIRQESAKRRQAQSGSRPGTSTQQRRTTQTKPGAKTREEELYPLFLEFLKTMDADDTDVSLVSDAPTAPADPPNESADSLAPRARAPPEPKPLQHEPAAAPRRQPAVVVPQRGGRRPAERQQRPAASKSPRVRVAQVQPAPARRVSGRQSPSPVPSPSRRAALASAVRRAAVSPSPYRRDPSPYRRDPSPSGPQRGRTPQRCATPTRRRPSNSPAGPALRNPSPGRVGAPTLRTAGRAAARGPVPLSALPSQKAQTRVGLQRGSTIPRGSTRGRSSDRVSNASGAGAPYGRRQRSLSTDRASCSPSRPRARWR